MENRILPFLLSENTSQGFRPIAVPAGIKEQLLETAVKAPTATGLQAYSMIIIEDLEQRRLLSQACQGQSSLLEAPLVVSFCVDTYRIKYILEQYQQGFFLDNPLAFLLGICDAITAAQNMVTAAGSKGLGATYISAFLNELEDIRKILKLPEYVFPVTILCLGYPVSAAPQKQGLKKIVYKDHYQEPGREQVTEFIQRHQHLFQNGVLQLYGARETIQNKGSQIWNSLQESGFFPRKELEKKGEVSSPVKLGLEKTLQVIRQAQRLTRKRKQLFFSRVNLCYKLAQYHLIRGHANRALDYFSQAILHIPEATELYCCIAVTHQHMGNRERSLSYFQKAARLDTKEPYFHLWLGEAQTFWGEIEGAQKALDKALNLNPALAEAWLAKAKLLEKQTAWEDALSCYQRVENLRVGNPTLYNNIAVVYLQLGKTADAEIYCDKALKLRPKDHIILANKGLILSKIGKFKEAAECYTQALKVQPDNVDYLNNKGYCLMKIKQYQKALALYELTLEIQPGVLSVLENKASCLTLLGRGEEALSCYDEILRHTPEEPTVLNNKALCLAKLGRYRQALLYHQRSLEKDPNNPTFLGNTARCLIEMGQYERALEYLDLALQLKPGEPGLLSSKGICLDYLGRLDEALVCYNRALRLA